MQLAGNRSLDRCTAHFRAPSIGCLRCRRHETGPSTTFNPDPSTIPRISRKPQAVYLRFDFCPRRHVREMSPKRSRWAGFVAGIPGAAGVEPDRRAAAAPPARGARPAGLLGHRGAQTPWTRAHIGPAGAGLRRRAPRDSGARAPGKFFQKCPCIAARVPV
jgi:hypothetical protein